MANCLRAALVVLPPLSVVVVAMAARYLCRVMARKLSALARSQFACLPSGGPSFRYLLVASPSSSMDMEEEDIIKGGGGGHQLPVALYSRRRTTPRRPGGKDDNEEDECVLCLTGIEEGSEVRELRCRHLFHRACLDRWVRARRPVAATCPLCRGRLLMQASPAPPWDYYDDEDSDSDSDSDMMLFMACVHSRSTWLWPSSS